MKKTLNASAVRKALLGGSAAAATGLAMAAVPGGAFAADVNGNVLVWSDSATASEALSVEGSGAVVLQNGNAVGAVTLNADAAGATSLDIATPDGAVGTHTATVASVSGTHGAAVLSVNIGRTATVAATDIGGAAGSIFNLTVGAINLSNGVGGTGALVIGSGAYTTNATITGAVTAQTVTVTGPRSTATFQGTVTSAGNNTFSDGATINISDAVATNGGAGNSGLSAATLNVQNSLTHNGGINVSNSSTIALGTNTLTVTGAAGNVAFTGDNTLTLMVGQTAAGRILATTSSRNVTIGDGTLTITPSIATGVTVKTSDRVLVARADTITLAGDASVVVTNTSLVSWTSHRVGSDSGLSDRYGNAFDQGGEDYFYIQATVASAASVTGVSSQSAGAIDSLMGGSGGDVSRLGVAVQTLTDPGEIDRVGKQIAGNTEGAAFTASATQSYQVLGEIGARADELRVAALGGGTGVAAGEALRGLGIWGQGYGTTARQSRRSTADGYSVRTWGLVVGADTDVTDTVRAGISYAYGRSRVTGKDNTAGDRTNVTSHTGTLYAVYFGNPWYVDGMVSYTRHNYNTSRTVSAAGLTLNPTGSFSGNQYTARVDVGHPLQVGEGTVFTPYVRNNYMHLSTKSYTESTAAGAFQSIGSSSSNVWQLGVGGRLTTDLKASNDVILRPEVRAYYGYDVVSSRSNPTQALAGGGQSYTAGSVQSNRHSLSLGVGMNVMSSGGVSLSTDYDAEWRNNYLGHTGRLTLRVEF